MPCWRLWRYEEPAIVLGCSQRAQRAAVEARAPRGLPVVEREAGGGAVLTGPWMLGLSLALPIGHAWLAGGVLPSYQRLGELHVAVLQALGIHQARAVTPQELRADRLPRDADSLAWACFGGLSPWEVVDVRGRKLVGLAQRRRQTGVLLVAGTLVTEPDWPLLCAAMDRPDDANVLRGRTVSCSQLQARPVSWQTVNVALVQQLAQALG